MWRVFAGFAGVAMLAVARDAPQPRAHTLWVYSVSGLPNPVTDGPTGDTLIQRAAASHVTVLYVSAYSPTANQANRYLVDEAAIATFIEKAHANRITVYVSMGDVDWPAKGCAAAATPYQRFNDIAGYDAAHPAARFDGVILDVEPGSNPDLAALLRLYQCFEQQTAASGLALAAAINAFWNSTVSFNGVTKEAYRHIVDLKLASLVVMGYRNTAGALDCSVGGVLCLDANVILYANSVGMAGRILVGLDTDDPAVSGAAASETFFAQGQAALDAVAQSVERQLAAAGVGVGGFSVHNYRNAYLSGTVSGWPATNPGLLRRMLIPLRLRRGKASAA